MEPPARSPASVPDDLAVSIVSYRTPALLERCLASLESERAALALRVTVVDNASGDGTVTMVQQRFPWVRLIANQENVGFGRAHNQALRDAHARHLLVLNSDTVVHPGALARLVSYLEDHPDIAVTGPRLLYPDGRTQPSRRRFPTPATFFLESTQIQRFWPNSGTLRHYYVADRPDDVEQDVDWLVGACLCVRAAAARTVGLFDEQFFLYSEEIDWCRRFRSAGWRVVYLPEAVVEHVEGGSSNANLLLREVTFVRSKLRYVAKWHGPRLAAVLRAYVVLEYGLRCVEETVKLGLGSRPAERRERLRLLVGALRQVTRG